MWSVFVMVEGDLGHRATVDKEEADVRPAEGGEHVALPFLEVRVEDLAGLGEDLGVGEAVEEDDEDVGVASGGRGLDDAGGDEEGLLDRAHQRTKMR